MSARCKRLSPMLLPPEAGEERLDKLVQEDEEFVALLVGDYDK